MKKEFPKLVYLPTQKAYTSLQQIENEFTNRIAIRIKYFSKKLNKSQSDFSEFDSEGNIFNSLSRQVINAIANNNVSYKKEFISEDKINVIAQNLKLTTCELLYGTDKEIEDFVKFLYEKIVFNFLPSQGKNIRWNTTSSGYIDEIWYTNEELLSVLSYSGRLGFILEYNQEIFNRMYPAPRIKVKLPTIFSRTDIQLQFEHVISHFWENTKNLFVDSFKESFKVNKPNIENWTKKFINWISIGNEQDWEIFDINENFRGKKRVPDGGFIKVLRMYGNFFKSDEIYALGYNIREQTCGYVVSRVNEKKITIVYNVLNLKKYY